MKATSTWVKLGTIAITVVGLLSSVISLFTLNNLIISVLLIVLCVAISLIVFLFAPKESLPEGVEAIAEELENPNARRTFKVIFPCNDSYYRAANKLAKEKFGKNTVSDERADEWKSKNDFLLTCLTDRKRFLGYFDILPLHSDFALKLINGSMGENDIRAEHIFSRDEMKNAEYLYFAGIAVKDTNSARGCLHATYLIFSAILYVRLFYANSKVRKILTIPTSECGLLITEHLKFNLETEGIQRKDGHDLYVRDFDLSEISELINSKKDLYNRFDIGSYFNTVYELTGETMSLPV